MSETYETMLLISQAVRSNMSLGEAIRLSIVDGQGSRTNRKLLRFASELDAGYELPMAARRAGLPRKLACLLEAAQQSGDFTDYFAELTEAERSRTKTVQMLVNLMSYPVFLILIMFLVVVQGIYTVPKFEAIFRDFDTNLPLMTEMAISTAHLFQLPQFYVAFIAIVIFLLVLQRLFFPTFWFYVPIVGRIFWSFAVEKLLRQLYISLKHQVPLDEALRLAAQTFRFNRGLYRECQQAADLAREGAKLSMIVSLYPVLFPSWLLPIVRTAEKNGSIPSALRHGITILEEDRAGSALLFGTVLTPIFCFFFVAVAGFFVLAMFMPLIKLITELSG